MADSRINEAGLVPASHLIITGADLGQHHLQGHGNNTTPTGKGPGKAPADPFSVKVN